MAVINRKELQNVRVELANMNVEQAIAVMEEYSSKEIQDAKYVMHYYGNVILNDIGDNKYEIMLKGKIEPVTLSTIYTKHGNQLIHDSSVFLLSSGGLEGKVGEESRLCPFVKEFILFNLLCLYGANDSEPL